MNTGLYIMLMQVWKKYTLVELVKVFIKICVIVSCAKVSIGNQCNFQEVFSHASICSELKYLLVFFAKNKEVTVVSPLLFWPGKSMQKYLPNIKLYASKFHVQLSNITWLLLLWYFSTNSQNLSLGKTFGLLSMIMKSLVSPCA